MLVKHIKKTFPEMSKDFHQKVFDVCVMYCVHSINAFECQKKFQVIFSSHKVKHSAKEFRLTLCDNGYFLFNFKFFLMSFVLRKMSWKANRHYLEEAVVEYKIKKSDFFYLLNFFKTKNGRKTLTEAFAKNTKNDIVKSIQAKEDFQKIYADINGYIKHITYKKLSFIIKSNNMCVDDMNCELMTKALRAYYSMLPCSKTDLHKKNYIKRVVHNHAMNVIARYTFQKRTRLVNIGGNFVLNTTSENQLRQGTDGIEITLDSLSEVHDVGFDKVDDNFTVASILSRYKNKKKKFLHLLFGNYDEGFTLYLHRSKKICSDLDNTDYYTKGILDYKRQVCKYLNLNSVMGDKFLKQVHKNHFS